MREMEITALAGITEGNQKAMMGLVDSYRRMLFPGSGDVKNEDSFEEKAKKQIADEAKKVYVVRPKAQGDLKETWQSAAKSVDPNMRALAARELRDEMKARARHFNKAKAKKKRKLPKGVDPEKR